MADIIDEPDATPLDAAVPEMTVQIGWASEAAEKIRCGFAWKRSPEGYQFWSEIHDRLLAIDAAAKRHRKLIVEGKA